MLLVVLFADHWTENVVAYFERWPASAVTQRIYNADLRAAAAYSGQTPADQPLYISTDFWLDLDQQAYLLYQPGRTDAGWFYGPHGLPLPPPGGRATYLWTASAENTSAALAALAGEPQGKGGQIQVATPSAAEVDDLLVGEGVRPLSRPIQYGDTLRLVAAGSKPAGNGIELITRWEVLKPWDRDMPPKLSARLVDATGHNQAQTDELLVLAYQGWQPGQEFVQVTQLLVPDDLRPADYDAVVAIYDDRNGQVGVAVGGEWLTTIPPAARVSVTAEEDRTRRQPGERPLTPLPTRP